MEKSFGVEPEITIKLAKKKFRFFEVPISYIRRSYEEEEDWIEGRLYRCLLYSKI